MFSRLKSDTSQSDPPTGHYQHQLTDTNSINKTHCRGITSDYQGDVAVESGLNWFHSITPSLSHDAVITSAPETPKTKAHSSWSETSTVSKQPNCPTDEFILSDTGSSLNYDVISNPFGTLSSASEQKNRESENNEHMKEKTQPERQKDKNHAKSSGSVIQKVSKNLRDRRRELELTHQQGDKQGERLVSVTDGLHTTAHSHTSSTLSSGKSCPSTNLKESHFEKEDMRDQTETETISTVLKEKVAAKAETGKELYAKLSGFTFKPRKTRHLVHNHNLNASSEVSAELHTSYPGSRASHQNPVSPDDSARTLTDTEKNKRKKRQNQHQNPLEGGKPVSCVSVVGESGSEAPVCSPSEGLQKDDFCFGKGPLAQRKTVDEITRSDDTETNVNTSINDPAPSTSGHKSTVATSTLAKLSRFSFTCTTDCAPTAQRDDAECSGANSKNKKTLNTPEHSPLLRKITMGKVKNIFPRTDTELTPGQEQEHKHGIEAPTKTKCRAEQTEPTHAANHSDSVSVANQKKRKCFELGHPPLRTVGGSKGPFSGLALFDSDELGNDVLDTDWDQEVPKKAKI